MTPELNSLEKWSGRLGNFMIGSLLIAIPLEIYRFKDAENWFLLPITILTLLLFIFTKWITTRLYYEIPITFQVGIFIFIYLTLYIGDGHGIYWKWGWYDIVAHALSGTALGFTGFLMLYMVMLREKVKLPPIYASLFVFSFSIMFGVLWEFFEYFMDKYAGTKMVKGSGVDDIIWDLLGDTFGALIAGIVSYSYLVGKKSFIFGKAVDYFTSINKSKLSKK
jgi:hypothetical protein